MPFDLLGMVHTQGKKSAGLYRVCTKYINLYKEQRVISLQTILDSAYVLYCLLTVESQLQRGKAKFKRVSSDKTSMSS